MAPKQIFVVIDIDGTGQILDYNVLNSSEKRVKELGLIGTKGGCKTTRCPSCKIELEVAVFESQTEIKEEQEVAHQDNLNYSIVSQEGFFELESIVADEIEETELGLEDAICDTGTSNEIDEEEQSSSINKIELRRHVKRKRSSSKSKPLQKDNKPSQAEIELTSQKQEDGTFLCLLCNKILPTKVGSITHQFYCKKKPTKEDLTCTECNKTFGLLSTLKVHIQRCHTEKTYCCHLCGSSFCRNTELEEHLIRHENPKPYECDLCHERYAVKNSLRDHMKTYHIETNAPFYCKLCNNAKKYPTEHKLQDHHKRVHSGDDRYACVQCPRRFKYPESLRNHMQRQHTPVEQQKWFPCMQCNFRGPTMKSLEKHRIIHLNDEEKPFKCSYCSKGKCSLFF